jgi:hypothetical protein
MTSFNKDNISQLQESIQSMVHNIEKEKINLRISQERYSKKFREYNEILGKPVALTKEQKLKMIKEKLEKLKKREIFSPNYGRRIRPINPEDEIKNLQKSSSLNEIKLNDIKKGVNKQALINERISHEINEIRKDKQLLQARLEKIEEENEEIERDLEFLKKKNQKTTKKLKYKDLKKTKEEGLSMEEKFKLDRNILEDKYHKVIEANIRRERLRNNELSKQRLANAVFADNARKKGKKSSKQESQEDQDEIQDRMPILDVLLDKWIFIIKYKKQMINKYINYSSQIRNAFDKLILFLGLEKYDELPLIYEKDEEQIAKIDELLSRTTNDVEELKSKKILLQKQIYILTETKKITNLNKQQYKKEKEESIENLKKLNNELEEEITIKRKLFLDMQESTFNFLKKMQNTYLVDFIVKRMNIEENSKINEQNVIDYLGSVYCYIQLINDFNENVQNKKMIKENLNKSNSVNKSIENLQKEIRLKLSKFNYDNCLNKVKKDSRQKSMFDEVIFRLANDIVNEVNNNYDYCQNPTSLNISDGNSNNNPKISKNLRYME